MTDTVEVTLKRCPFCGSESISILQPKHGGFYPYCNGCNMELEGQGTEAEAIAAWNTRHDATRELRPWLIDYHDELVRQGLVEKAMELEALIAKHTEATQ